jgi:hypothetical protein
MSPSPIQYAAVAKAAVAMQANETPAAPTVAAPEPTTPQIPWTDGITAALEEIAKFLKESRAQQQAFKRAESDARYHEALEQVGELHEKANATRVGAFVSTAFIGMSAGNAWTANRATAHDDKNFANLATAFAKADEGMADQSGKLADAAGTDHEAAAKGHEALGERHRDRADAASDRARDLGDLVTKAHDAIRAVLEARHAARMAAIGTRG